MHALPSMREYKALPDQLLYAAFDGQAAHGEPGLERLHALAAEGRELWENGWQNVPNYGPVALRLVTSLACMPSLETVALDKPHTPEVAGQVVENLRDLTGYVLSEGFADMRSRAQSEKQQEISGRLSEIAVFNSLWWGAAHDLWPATAYILPTTRSQDAGQRLRDGYSMRTDFIMRRAPELPKDLIQVKTTFQGRQDTTMNPPAEYHPSISILTPVHLLNRTVTKRHSRALLQAFAEDRTDVLATANEVASNVFDKTREKSAAHEESRD